MRTIEADARRYAWSRGQAVWRVGLPIAALLEDMRGALDEGQHGLVRRNARVIGQNCAVVVNLVVRQDRPLPAPRMRASWALDRLADHPLGRRCRALLLGHRDVPAGRLVELAEQLVAEVRALVGDVPDPLAPDGYFPSLAAAREWLTLVETVGEDGFLPREWTRGA
jgi:hypothetical protein